MIQASELGAGMPPVGAIVGAVLGAWASAFLKPAQAPAREPAELWLVLLRIAAYLFICVGLGLLSYALVPIWVPMLASAPDWSLSAPPAALGHHILPAIDQLVPSVIERLKRLISGSSAQE